MKDGGTDYTMVHSKKSSFVRIAAAQINTTVGDLEGNTCKVIEWIDRARKQEVQVLAFPELTLCGYPPKDLLLKTQFISDQQEYLEKIYPHTQGMIVLVGLVVRERDTYNAVAVIHDGKLVTIAKKVELPNYRVFDEKRYFDQGEHLTAIQTDIASFGVMICEDIWHPETVANMATSGVDFIVCLSASPFSVNRSLEREIMIRTRCQDHGVGMLFCNLVCGQDELIFDGRSMLVTPQGRIIKEGRAFEEDLIVGDIKFEEIHRSRMAVPLGRDIEPIDVPGRLPIQVVYSEGRILKAHQESPEQLQQQNPFLPKIVSFHYDPVEDAFRALVLECGITYRKMDSKKWRLVSAGVSIPHWWQRLPRMHWGKRMYWEYPCPASILRSIVKAMLRR
jgi:NAD+ synthase (glutamine-hydrolysing)